MRSISILLKSKRILLVVLTLAFVLTLVPIADAQYFEYSITGSSLSILIRDVTMTTRHVNQNDEIAALTPEGLCSGASEVVIPFEMIGLAAWGDDPHSEAIDGFAHNQAITLKYWDSISEEEFTFDEAICHSGEFLWISDQVYVVDLFLGERVVDITPTMNAHRILVENFHFVIENEETVLEDFTQIIVKTPNGVDAGILVWDMEKGIANGICYMDDPETEEVEGFAEGEAFTFEFYLASRESFFEADLEINSGNETFAINGITKVNLSANVLSVKELATLPTQMGIVSVYPNPFNATTNISVNFVKPTDYFYEVYDTNGRFVMSNVGFVSTTGLHSLRLNMLGMPAGNYFLMLKVDGNHLYRRITLLN